MPVTNGRSRKAGINRRQLLFLLLGVGALLSLSFVLGIVVGRQWNREPSLHAQSEKGKKSALTARGALREAQAERTGQIQEKLTFYQSLTAPLGAAPSEASKPAAKPPVPPKPTTKLPEPPQISEATSASGPKKPSDENRSAPPPETPAARRSETSAPPDSPAAPAGKPFWTVQVGAYRARNMAEELQKTLRAAGYDAYVTTVTFDDGKVHYRVRVGSFSDRSQAERTAERLKAERSIVPFVTQN
jgi:cell division septation protein DedD